MASLKKENQKKLEQNTQMQEITAEVLDHMMNPRNYGTMEDANGVGMAVDNKTGEFAMVYIKLIDGVLEDISYGVNACQDTVVAGSLFTEMIKKDTLPNAISALKLMDEKLMEVSKKQRLCSGMVLEAFRSALINREHRLSGEDEDMFTFNLKDSCEGVNLG